MTCQTEVWSRPPQGLRRSFRWKNMSADRLAQLPDSIKYAYNQVEQGAVAWAQTARDDPEKFAAMTGRGTGNAMFQAVLAEVGSELGALPLRVLRKWHSGSW
jgi:hypothetical protein